MGDSGVWADGLDLSVAIYTERHSRGSCVQFQLLILVSRDTRVLLAITIM